MGEELTVIIRVFRARARAEMGATHERMMRELSMPLVEAQRGLIAFYVGRPVGSNADEYTMVSLWEDIEALRTFAGDDWEQAVIPEPERPNLQEVHVHHYEAIGTGGQAAQVGARAHPQQP
jgi:heme-degrading monooxygenase HmoA